MKKISTLARLSLAILAFPLSAEAQKAEEVSFTAESWTRKSDGKSITATFVAYDSDKQIVTLKMSSGKIVKLNTELLSEADMTRIQGYQKNLEAAELAVFFACSSDKDTYDADFPEKMPTRQDAHYLRRINHFKTHNPDVKPGGIVLLGDSITESFPVGLAPSEWNLQSRGISGDGIGGGKYRGLINRLHISCHDLKPSKVFVKIGINDIVRVKDTTATEVSIRLKAYEQMIKEIQKHNPGVEIILCSSLPTITVSKWGESLQLNDINDDVVSWNAAVEKLAEKYELEYVDLHKKFLKGKKMDRSLSTDGVHLNKQGYAIWMDELKRVFK